MEFLHLFPLLILVNIQIRDFYFGRLQLIVFPFVPIERDLKNDLKETSATATFVTDVVDEMC